MTLRPFLASLALVFLAGTTLAQTPVSGRRARRLLIHNATVVDGNGTPASGPKDIVIENNTITDVIALDPVAISRGGARNGPTPDAAVSYTHLMGEINAEIAVYRRQRSRKNGNHPAA